MKFLVIVESPAKTKKIQAFLNTIKNHTFIVEASFGHIRYFQNGLKSIDTKDNYKAKYSIIAGKNKVVKNLKEQLKKVDEVVIATDQDREGEAIGFHIAYTLNLDIDKTKRICFNEITQKAVVDAFNNSRKLDYNLFNAQQARSILDILIGFEISPLLWKSIQPKLSAGRCQSPALKLIYERDKLIDDFTLNKTYSLIGDFIISQNNIEAEYHKNIDNKEVIKELLPQIVNDTYKLDFTNPKKVTHSPPPPFTTSTIQQEASSRFSLSPKLTMSILQQLYEKGKITYMRTDSVAISNVFIDQIKEYCNNNSLGDYFKQTFYKNKTSNSQEAHECIRPVNIDFLPDQLSGREHDLYKIIRNRTIMSQLKKYREDEYNYKLVSTTDSNRIFKFILHKITDIGFKIISEPNKKDDKELITSIDQTLTYTPTKVIAKEKHSKPKPRYTEAMLVKELEDKGIGRPSTFSSLVSKVLERKYVNKATSHNYKDINLECFEIVPGGNIEEKTIKSKSQSEKNKLFITDIGKIVCEFIENNFENINSYNFTSEIENDLDRICNNEVSWYEVIDKVYIDFHKKIEEMSKDTTMKTEKKKLQKPLGVNPETGKNIYKYIGKFGPCIQEGEHGENPKYVSITKDDDHTLDSITLEIALNYLEFPKTIGKLKDSVIYLKKGKFGLYLECDKKRVSVDKADINLTDAISLLESVSNGVIKEFSNVKVLNGKYGPYIKKGTKMVSVPKDKEAEKLTKKECEEIIKNYKPKKFTKFKKN